MEASTIRTIPNDYRHYLPLNFSKREIRLLQVRPLLSPSELLQVVLVRTTLANHPPYKALSYCWGSLDNLEPIGLVLQESTYVSSSPEPQLIDGEERVQDTKSFNVTTNLRAALHSFQKTNTTSYIWVDMLCINQGDIFERSQQVSFMKGIYASADSVIVWLGNNPELSSAIHCDENAELVLFVHALEQGGQPVSLREEIKRFANNVPESFDCPNMRTYAPQVDPSTSSFCDALLHSREKIMRLQHNSPPRNEQEGLTDGLANLFLIWIHNSYITMFQRKLNIGLSNEHGTTFLAYFKHITSQQSDVWQFVQHAVAEYYAKSPLGFCESITRRMMPIASHSWFRRVWVLQEVASNRTVFVRVGIQETSWDTVSCLDYVCHQIRALWLLWLRIPQYAVRVMDLPKPAAISPLWSQISRQQRQVLELPILEIISQLDGFDATDPRDMVFAIYHLATDISAHSFGSDYTKSFAETYALFTKFIIEKTKSLRIFSFASGCDSVAKGLPTWVPDFRKLQNSGTFLSRAYHQPGPGTTSIPRLHSSTSTTLALEGVQVGTIKEVIGIKFLSAMGDKIGRDDLAWNKLPLPLTWACICNCYQLFFLRNPTKAQYLEDDRSSALTLKTFMEVLVKRDGGDDGSTPFFTPLWKQVDPTLTKINYSWRDKEDMRRWMRNCDTAPTIATMAMLRVYLNNTAFFFSDDGRLGICPMTAESGDIVVALHGSGAQLVLRPTPLRSGISFADEIRRPPTYQLVGDCYLDGFMAGKQTWADDPQWHDMLHEDPLDLAPWLDPKITIHRRSEFWSKVFRIE